MAAVRLECETTDEYMLRHPGCLHPVRPARSVALAEPGAIPAVTFSAAEQGWWKPETWWGQPMAAGRTYVARLDGAVCFGGVGNKMSRATGTHAGGQLLVTADGTLIDESFKVRNRARTLPADLVARDGDSFELLAELDDVTEAPGEHVLLGATHPGHFGHFLTEGLARAWLPANATYVVYEPRLKPWQSSVLGALGITRVHHVDGPTRFERLLAPSPACNLHQWMAPEMGYTWGRVRDAVEPGSDELVYLSRSRFTKRRSLVNEEAVERMFAERGFTIVHPQEVPILEQVALAAGARVLAGSGGSNMYLGAFQHPGTDRVILSPRAFTLGDDAQISHVAGTRLSYVLGEPVRDARGPRAADYEVSLDHVAEVLRRVLGR